MSATKRLSLVRQFSLQCETSKTQQQQQQQRRQSLKKQASEELTEVRVQPEAGMRISLSAKIADRPPAAKLAWTEKPSSPKTTTTTAKESILDNVSRDLNDRLRRAWKDKEQGRQNIDIFLTPNRDEDAGDASETDRSVRAEKSGEPKIILPLKPEVSTENMKNVFQKRMRKTVKQKSLFGDSPRHSPTTKCPTIVVPVIDRKSITPPPAQTKRILSRQNTMEKEQDKAEEILAKQVVSNIVIRPSTAASRREMFQKRTNSAFQGSIKKDGGGFRPPLTRASSVPSKPEQKQSKFLAANNKRTRAKTAKAKLKSEEDDGDLSSGRGGGGGGGRRSMQRCVSVNGEVETMISLISPSGSDNEAEEEQEEKTDEGEEEEKGKPKLDEKLECYREEQKNFSLRKTVKSVSFQQSSIHAVRSFSASFPARRCSVATALMLGGNKTTPGKVNAGGGQKIQEKRAPLNVLEDEQSVPKRRLVRTKSAPPQQQSVDDANEEEPSTENEGDEISAKIPAEEKGETDEALPKKEEEGGDDAPGSSGPKFENPKEKQCWDLYRKMSAKGVAISFDTILRGMLTPTEYRLRRKPSLVPEDNCEITTGN